VKPLEVPLNIRIDIYKYSPAKAYSADIRLDSSTGIKLRGVDIPDLMRQVERAVTYWIDEEETT